MNDRQQRARQNAPSQVDGSETSEEGAMMSETEQNEKTTDYNEFNRKLIEEFRANGGKVSGMFAGAPLLLLTTTGARSGQSWVVPLLYSTDNGRFVVIASKGGAPTHPDWF